MPPLRENRVFTLLTELAACLCEQINDPENDLPGTCFCGVIPGEGAVMDYADNCEDGLCGMTYVRLSSVYPSERVGQPNEQVGNCGLQIGLDIEMGILRCISPGIDEAGNLPTDSQLLAAVEAQIADSLALMRAVNCCPSLPNKDFILGAYVPVGPMGGIYGGTITLSAIV